MAQKCSEYIDDGDCIYIDSGSTTYQIAKYIKQKKETDRDNQFDPCCK
ncbi:hypothetical protein RCO48_24660 [Peribacillus frigoritolerans]|nr:hypothetical protein [Peribacillus frigoritolerans]